MARRENRRRRDDYFFLLLGAGSIFDLSGQSTYDALGETLPPDSYELNDAIAESWRTVGQELANAMNAYPALRELDSRERCTHRPVDAVADLTEAKER